MGFVCQGYACARVLGMDQLAALVCERGRRCGKEEGRRKRGEGRENGRGRVLINVMFSDQSQPINVTFNSTAPTATINPSNHSDSQDHPNFYISFSFSFFLLYIYISLTNFYISIKNISEINANGVVMRSIVFSTVNFTLNVTQMGLNQVYNYSAVLSNRALVNVIVSPTKKREGEGEEEGERGGRM